MKKFVSLLVVLAVIMTMLPVTYGDGERIVTGLSIVNQPNLIYYIGDPLDLLGPMNDSFIYPQQLTVEVTFEGESDPWRIGFDDFEVMGITTDPANGTELTASHHGQSIKVSYGGFTVWTDSLSVTEPVEGATLVPSACTFDKNPTLQEDVLVELQWFHKLLYVSDVKNGDISIGIENYSVYTQNGKDILSISKNYLNTLPTGECILTVEFPEGDRSLLTINILKTNIPPYFPDDSAITISRRTASSVTLSWPAASDDTEVLRYVINVYKGADLLHSIDCDDTVCEITELSPNTAYDFEVFALDEDLVKSTSPLTVTVKTVKKATGITVTTQPKLSYFIGEELDLLGQ